MADLKFHSRIKSKSRQGSAIQWFVVLIFLVGCGFLLLQTTQPLEHADELGTQPPIVSAPENLPVAVPVEAPEATPAILETSHAASDDVDSADPMVAAVESPPVMPTQLETQGLSKPRADLSKFQDFSSWLAVIEGDRGSGSGFIANYNSQAHLFTNTHVLSGKESIRPLLLNREPLESNGLRVADTYDVTLIAQSHLTSAFEILESIDRNVNIGDEVVVYGNSLGSSVVTEIFGKVVGIGPEKIEVDAKFVQGNSGSPIVHIATGKIIGIATEATLRSLEWHGMDSKFHNEVRRFGYRLDNLDDLRDIQWDRFVVEGKRVQQAEELTASMWLVLEDISTHGKITNWTAHLNSHVHVANAVRRWQRALAQGTATAHISGEKRKFLSSLQGAVVIDSTFFRENQMLPYHRKRYEDLMDQRGQMSNYFRLLSQQITNDPEFKTR